MTYIYVVLLAAIIAIMGVFIFRKLKIMDRPGTDLKNTRKPVPTIQWVFVYGWFLAIIGLLFPEYYHQPLFLWLILWSLPIVIVQFLDEMHYIQKSKLEIPSWVRLISHIIGAIIAVYVGGMGNQEILIGTYKRIMPTRAVAIFFIARSTLCINAINRFDGIYAQASGVSTVGFFTIFFLIKYIVFWNYVDFTPEKVQMLTMIQNIAFALWSISLVSTVIEFKPLALVRDVGIMFFGFSLAYLSVVWGAKIGTLIVALSLVIFDAIWVGFWRIFILKKSPLQWDYTHLHHRLLGLGWTRPEARATIWIWSLVMMILILLQGIDRGNKVIIAVMMAALFFGINAYLFLVRKLPCGLNMKKEI